jgi:hypothetical protein
MKTRSMAAAAALWSALALCGPAVVSGQETATATSTREAAKASADALSQAAKQAADAAKTAKVRTGVWVQNGENPFGRTIALGKMDRGTAKFFSAGPGGSPLEARIRDAAARVNDATDDADRQAAATELTSLLDKYFEEDMQSRAKELEDIQKRLANLQAQLDHRRAKKQEIIDLQTKVALNEADGLGFYSERKGQLFNFSMPAPIVSPVPVTVDGMFAPVPDKPPMPAPPVR